MENVVIKKRKKLNVKNLCLLIFFLVMLIVFLFSLIKVIMWIIDNNNTNDIIMLRSPMPKTTYLNQNALGYSAEGVFVLV